MAKAGGGGGGWAIAGGKAGQRGSGAGGLENHVRANYIILLHRGLNKYIFEKSRDAAETP